MTETFWKIEQSAQKRFGQSVEKNEAYSLATFRSPRPRFNVGDGALTIFRDMTEKV